MPRSAMILGIFLTVLASACVSPTDPVEEAYSALEEQRRSEMIERTAWVRKNADTAELQDLFTWTQDASFAGREDLTAEIDRLGDLRSDFICESDNDAIVIEQIADLAKTHSVIIINEHHAKPQHRVFIRELAVRLKSEGFTHYAAESFAPEIHQGQGYPNLRRGGYFAMEPMMARSIHHLRALGYKLVAYEAQSGQFDPFDKDVMRQIDQREEAQANNLMEAVLEENPDTKIIIHVGHGHVVEFPIQAPGSIPWMAARLKEKSGIDPLSISFTECRSGGPTAVLSTKAVNENGIVHPKLTDFMIGLSEPNFTRGRPNYRLEMGDQFVDVPEALKPDEDPVLIEARPPSTELGKSPVERLFLVPGEDVPLLLPPGDWSLISIDAEGTITGPVEVSVGGE